MPTKENTRIAVSKILGIGSRYGQSKRPITEDEVNFACKLLEKYQGALSNPLEQEWVSVDERLPETQAWCLCAIKGGVLVYACEYFHTIKQWYGYGDAFPETRITHWQPLPNPPKNLV